MKKVLIIKISAIGDVVMALPMLDAISRKYPDAHITWMCGETIAPLLKTFDKIDELIVVNEKKLLTGNILEKLGSLFSVWKRLLFHRFDLIVTGNADPRYRLLSLTAIGKERRSFGPSWPMQGRHHSDEYVRLITNVDGQEVPKGRLPILSIPLPDKLSSALNSPDSQKVVLAPGGAKNVMRDDAVRRWPLDSYVNLADRLRAEGIQVIIMGAPSDKWVSDSFSHLDVIDLVGKTSLLELIALLGVCDLTVTHDSSPLHLTGLAGRPVVALFGPTNPYEKVPHNQRSKILWGGENLACRPCYEGKTYATCNNNICLQSISVDQVYEAVMSILEK